MSKTPTKLKENKPKIKKAKTKKQKKKNTTSLTKISRTRNDSEHGAVHARLAEEWRKMESQRTGVHGCDERAPCVRQRNDREREHRGCRAFPIRRSGRVTRNRHIPCWGRGNC